MLAGRGLQKVPEMQPPQTPGDETARLRALHECQLLDTAPEARFDRLTRLATRLFSVPIALVSLVDADRQWFKSRQGLAACETGRDISFCGHAILGIDVFCVPDALADQRFSDNPLVAGPPHIRFYAGAPLRTREGRHIGTLCIIDDKPRQFPLDQRTLLRELADCVEQEIEDSRILAEHHALMTFSQISALAHANPEDALGEALALSCRYLRMSNGSVRKREPDGEVIMRISLNEEDEAADESRYAAMALQKGESFVVEGQQVWRHSRGTATRFLAVPIGFGGHAVGALCFYCSEAGKAHPFTTTQMEFARMVASWATSLLRRAGMV
jgi:GAF domain-containing protein